LHKLMKCVWYPRQAAPRTKLGVIRIYLAQLSTAGTGTNANCSKLRARDRAKMHDHDRSCGVVCIDVEQLKRRQAPRPARRNAEPIVRVCLNLFELVL
jgi:hypothetical protein